MTPLPAASQPSPPEGREKSSAVFFLLLPEGVGEWGDLRGCTLAAPNDGPMARARVPFLKDLGWRVEAFGYDLISFLLRIPPTDLVSAAGGALFRAFGPVTGAHRTAALGLKLAMPDLTPPERRRILADQWDNFGRFRSSNSPSPTAWPPAGGRVEIVGVERLQAIAASGQPAVLISGHFAQFEAMAAVILAAGVTCNVTYRAANNPYIDTRIIKSRRRYGVKLLAAKGGEGARDLIGSLKAGVSIAMLNDQRYDSRGVAAPFFGRVGDDQPGRRPLCPALRRADRADVHPAHQRGALSLCHPSADRGDDARRQERRQDRRCRGGRGGHQRLHRGRLKVPPGGPARWWWLHRRWPAADYKEAAAFKNPTD